MIRARWVVGLALPVVTAGGARLLGVPLPEFALYALGAAILAYNALLWRSARAAGEGPWHACGWQIALDGAALAAAAYLTGSAESPLLVFFLLHALLAAKLLPGHAAYLYTAAATVLVGGMTACEAAGWLPHVRILTALPAHLHRDPLYVAVLLVSFGAALWLEARLAVPAFAELREHERRLRMLYQSMQMMPSSLDLPRVLDQLVSEVVHALQTRAASIRLLDETGSYLQITAAYGLRRQYLDKGPVEVAHSPLDQETLRGRPVIVAETASDSRLQYRAEILSEGIHAVLSVPLVGRHGPVGVLRVYDWRPGFFSPRDADFVGAIARQGAMAIENAMTYSALQRADQLQSQFVRAVTHELRAPVAGAQSLLRTVTHDLAGGLNDVQRDILTRLSHRLDALQLLIDDLLDLAAGKVEGLEAALAPVSVEAVTLSIIDRLSAQAAEKNVGLRLDYVPRGLTVMASEDGLGRILVNLIGNAVKYTPAGGRVDVTLEQQGEEVSIAVADTGIGIPETDLPRIFGEFFRAGNAKAAQIQGTGLGLAIVKDLVTRYGGRASVQSQVGVGSTFTVTLPLAERPR